MKLWGVSAKRHSKRPASDTDAPQFRSLTRRLRRIPPFLEGDTLRSRLTRSHGISPARRSLTLPNQKALANHYVRMNIVTG
jgi:hypothetical protein